MPALAVDWAVHSVTAGETVRFVVAPSGSPPPFCQWLLDGVPIAGATNAALVLSNCTGADAGRYTVAVSNLMGCVTGAVTTLAVRSPGVSATVSNVRAKQRFGTPDVDITYDLTGAQAGTVAVSVGVSTNGGVSYFTPSCALAGDVGSVSCGASKKVVWDAGATLPPKLFSNMRARVTAEGGLPDEYLVIDLSGGPAAASYPVSYSGGVPPGGWTEEHKTSKLVLRKLPGGDCGPWPAGRRLVHRTGSP